MQAMHDAEKILMEDMPVIPIYYYTNVWLDNGKVKNYVHDALLGHMMFTWATKDGGEPIYYHLRCHTGYLGPAAEQCHRRCSHHPAPVRRPDYEK